MGLVVEGSVTGPRLLVAIACYGLKNTELLQRVIRQYQSMSLLVDIVVLSNIPRDLGPRVRVIVGLPSENPWSLPFAHQPLFVENVDNYDLFAYTEDDIGVSEQNIQAFLRASEQLASDEIAGFLRYEVDSGGAWSLPDIHGGYHWRPNSARHRGDYTIAEHTNEHAGFYLINREQLAAMIAQDGFVRKPYEGRYDMLCSAATDPYTAYGFRKVVCISALDDFLIHHLSDRYAGKMGTPLTYLQQQVMSLAGIAEGSEVASTLFDTETQWPDGQWAKNYYDQPEENLLQLVPEGTRSLLSIGCGWGATEASLADRGIAVTAVPIDSVVLGLAARPELEIVHGSFEACLETLRGRQFDCILISGLLHLLPNPGEVIGRCSILVREGGGFVIGGPNFGSLRVMLKRAIDKGGYRKLRSYSESGISLVGPGSLQRELKPLGFEISATRWFNRGSTRDRDKKIGRWGSTDWLIQARYKDQSRVS